MVVRRLCSSLFRCKGASLFDHALLASILVSLSILTVPCGSAQTAQQQQGGSGGMATGGVFQPVYDSAKRPITAGGTVKTGPVVFMNTAEQAGLTNWHHTAGTPPVAIPPDPPCCC